MRRNRKQVERGWVVGEGAFTIMDNTSSTGQVFWADALLSYDEIQDANPIVTESSGDYYITRAIFNWVASHSYSDNGVNPVLPYAIQVGVVDEAMLDASTDEDLLTERIYTTANQELVTRSLQRGVYTAAEPPVDFQYTVEGATGDLLTDSTAAARLLATRGSPYQYVNTIDVNPNCNLREREVFFLAGSPFGGIGIIGWTDDSTITVNYSYQLLLTKKRGR